MKIKDYFHDKNLAFQSLQKTSQNSELKACIVTCADPRLSPEIIFNSPIGELAVIRNAGALLNENVFESLHFLVEGLGLNAVIYLPHKDCKALENAISPQQNFESKTTRNLLKRLKETPCSDAIEEYAKFGAKEIKKSLSQFQNIEVLAGVYDPHAKSVLWLDEET